MTAHGATIPFMGYRGPWPPWPGLFPVVIEGRAAVLVVHVWDTDATKQRIQDDLALLADAPAGVAVVHFGTPAEIAAVCADDAEAAAEGIRQWIDSLADVPNVGRTWWHGPPWKLRQAVT